MSVLVVENSGVVKPSCKDWKQESVQPEIHTVAKNRNRKNQHVQVVEIL